MAARLEASTVHCFQVICPRSVYLMAPLLLKAQVLAATLAGTKGTVLWMVALHAPDWQVCPWGHALPQPPQLVPSVAKFDSQPLTALLSQLPYPWRHPVSMQTLFTHAEVPLGKLHWGQVHE